MKLTKLDGRVQHWAPEVGDVLEGVYVGIYETVRRDGQPISIYKVRAIDGSCFHLHYFEFTFLGFNWIRPWTRIRVTYVSDQGPLTRSGKTLRHFELEFEDK